MKLNNYKYILLPNIFILFSITSYGKTNNQFNKRIIIEELNEITKTSLKNSLNNNQAIIFDLKKNPKEINQLATEITGLSFPNSKQLIIAKNNNGYTVIPVDTDISSNKIEEFAQSIESKNQANSRKKRSTEAPIGKEIIVKLIETHIKCPLPDLFFYTGKLKKDFCSERASLNLSYKFHLFQLKPGQKINSTNRENIPSIAGKFVVVSVSPNEGSGTGWHLAENILHEKKSTSSWSLTIEESAGPIASNYEFWVKAFDNENKLDLIASYPQNNNPEQKISDKISNNFNLTGNISGSSNPLQVGISNGLSNETSIDYNTTEYKIENISNIAMNSLDIKEISTLWRWNLKLNEPKSNLCKYFSYYTITNSCITNWANFQSSHSEDLILTGNLSPMTHKSFTPNFQAVFKASEQSTGKTNFEVGTQVEATVFLASLYKQGFISFGATAELKSYSKKLNRKSTSFTVDWDSPAFDTEEKIYLQTSSDPFNTKCLTANKSNNSVTLQNCLSKDEMNENHSQTWSYNNKSMQLKSRLKKDYCLSANGEYVITSLKECTTDNTQKWLFNTNSKQITLGSEADSRWILATSDPYSNDVSIIDSSNPYHYQFYRALELKMYPVVY